MPMQEALYSASEGLDQTFSVIQNARIISSTVNGNPAFSHGKVFLKSRRPLVEIEDFDTGGIGISKEILSVGRYEIPNGTSQRILISEEQGVTYEKHDGSNNEVSLFPCYITSFEDVLPIFPKEEVSGGTILATGGDNPVGSVDAYIEATGESWTENEFINKYVWITYGKGIGQIQKIKSNDATKIYVEGWTNADEPDGDSRFKIYESVDKTAIATPKTLNINSLFYDKEDAQLVPMPFIAGVIKSFDDRMWYGRYANEGSTLFSFDAESKLCYSEVGQPFLIAGFIDFEEEIQAMTSFNGFIFVATSFRLYLVYNIQTDVAADPLYNKFEIAKINVSGTSPTAEVFHKMKDQLYIAANKNVYAISVDTTGDRPIGKLQLISKTVEKYLSSTIEITSDNSNLIIISLKNVCIYDFENKGWRVYTFDENVVKILTGSINDIDEKYTHFYVGSRILIPDSYNSGDAEYANQKISITLGEDNPFNIKKLAFVKALFQVVDDEDPEVLCTVESFGSGRSSTLEKRFVVDSDSNVYNFGSGVVGDTVEEITENGFRIVRIAVQRTGNFFRITFTNDADQGFVIGDIALYFQSWNGLLNGKQESL
jgi:hypothetical protein